VLLAELARKGRHVFPIYIRAGLRWERVEIAALRKFTAALERDNLEPVGVLDFPTVDITRDYWSVTGAVPSYRASLESNYIPGRNLSLLTKAAMFCARNRIGAIAMAPLESNPFPDARPEFFRAFERAVKLGMELPLRVVTPFEGREKSRRDQKGQGAAAGADALMCESSRLASLRRVHQMRRAGRGLPRRRRSRSNPLCARFALTTAVVGATARFRRAAG
jgi:7-cyano-7-deazaguanine synthase